MSATVFQKMWSKPKHVRVEHLRPTARDQLSKYVDIRKEMPSLLKNIFEFWKDKARNLPDIYALACRFLRAPAISALIKRVPVKTDKFCSHIGEICFLMRWKFLYIQKVTYNFVSFSKIRFDKTKLICVM